MKFDLNYQTLSIFLIIFSVFSFFFGFYADEVSMGAGGYDGDFDFVQKSITLFIDNSIIDSILLFSESSNRPPLIYILHKIFNPLFGDAIGFRRVVFVISLSIPILLFLCFKERFKNTNNILLLLFTSVIFLNPFFRTSSFWGLEENYAYITLLLSLLYLMKLENIKKKSNLTIYIELSILTLASSLCIYFDQKFIIIPLICFLKIMNLSLLIRFKIFSVFLYFIFSIPFLYLIYTWKGIFPKDIYNLGNNYFIHHIGFTLTMIAFNILPFLLIIKENFKEKFFLFFENKNNYFYLLIILIYITFLAFFYDNAFIINKDDGGGVIKKISFILFDNFLLKQIFIYLAFLFSWMLIIFFLEKNIKDKFIILYFLFISLVASPFFQEYVDPLIFFLIFFIFKIKLNLNFKSGIIFYTYFFIFLFSSNIYYNNLL
jgi:hypothetical protein